MNFILLQRRFDASCIIFTLQIKVNNNKKKLIIKVNKKKLIIKVNNSYIIFKLQIVTNSSYL